MSPSPDPRETRRKRLGRHRVVECTGAPDGPKRWQPETLPAKACVVAMHLLPGLVAYGLLRWARQPLQTSLGLTSAEAQIGMIMTGVMLAMAAATFALARVLDGLGPRETVRLAGLTRFDPVGALLATLFWIAVLAIPSIVGYEDDLRALVERSEWLALPSWHFQETDGFKQVPALVGALALVANLLGEELWFRGYLQDKLAFVGRLRWIAAGLLFTLYHVFEAPIAYPGFLGAIALAGLWALRRSLWPCILLHALLNAPV